MRNWIAPKNIPSPVWNTDVSPDMTEEQIWCLNNVGKYKQDWNCVGTTFYFKREADFIMFTLRWEAA